MTTNSPAAASKGPYNPRIMEMLKESALSYGLDDAEQRILSLIMEIQNLKDGEYLADITNKHFIYAIDSGALSVEAKNQTHRISLHILAPGDLAGEFAFLEDVERTARLKALGATQLLCLERRVFEELSIKHPQIAFRILKNIIRFIRQSLIRMNTQNLDFLNYIKSHT